MSSECRTFVVPIVEGVVLILAVLGFTGLRNLPFIAFLKTLPSRAATGSRAVSAALLPLPRAPKETLAPPGWFVRNAPTLRIVLPAYILLAAAMIAMAAVNWESFTFGNYLVTLLVFGAFLAILGLGQGAVIIAGGLDLSVAWTITFPAIVVTTFANGSDAQAVWAIPLALGLGALIGLANGALVVGFRLSPIIATLAVGSILEGVALVFSGGAPTGAAPPMLTAFVNGRFLGLPPIVWFLFLFAVAATLILNFSAFGRRLRATGSSEWIARLSGVRTGSVIVLAYVLSGFCAALVGLLLAGFTAQAYYDMGRPYLLASIAVVVLGGTSITGGRGHYLGIFGGALVFTALSSLLASTSLPEAVRSIVYGIVLLGRCGDAPRPPDELIETKEEDNDSQGHPGLHQSALRRGRAMDRLVRRRRLSVRHLARRVRRQARRAAPDRSVQALRDHHDLGRHRPLDGELPERRRDDHRGRP